MIGEAEDARISSYQSFDTLSFAGGQRKGDHSSPSRVLYFGEDLIESIPFTSERPKKTLSDFKTSKAHGCLTDSSWVSTGASESSVSHKVNSSETSKSSQSNNPVSSAFFTEDMTPEFAFTQYQRRSEDQVCQVCGQPSVGFHHRAYVCEACKKFFTRHLTNRIRKDKPVKCKDDPAKSPTQGGEIHPDLNVVCPMGGNCKIEGPGRGKCPHCRFRKCLDLGMSLTPPGGEIGCDVSKIPCRVCNGPSSGFHFGALTCEGCKGFFRRTVHSNSVPQCLGNRTCRITPSNRNMCKSCRFKKCLSVGMSQKRSRVGRQPNAIKYYCMREISHREQSGELESPEDSALSKQLPSQAIPVCDTASHSPSLLQSAIPTSAVGVAKRSLNTFQAVNLMLAPTTTTVTSGVEAVLIAAGSTDEGRTRSRTSTLSTSSDVSSSSAIFQNSLEAKQGSPVFSASSFTKLKTEDTKKYDTGVDMVDNSFCEQLASVNAANSFANQLLRGTYSSQLPQTQSTPTTEFISQLARHHPTMVAAAAASLLWGNPSNVSVFEPEHTRAAMRTPPHLFSYSPSSVRCHPHQPFEQSTLPKVSHPVGIDSHQSAPFASLPQCLRPPATGGEWRDQVRSWHLQNDALEDAEIASPVKESIWTNAFVTLSEFTQGIERAADFIRSERTRLKRIRNNSQPRFTYSDTIERVWSQMMRQFVSHARMVVDFSKLVAGFNRLGINDRRQLIRAAMYPIMLVELSRDFQNNGAFTYNYFDFLECEKDVIINHFPPFTQMISHLVQFGKALRLLKLDHIESTIICIQELLRHRIELEDPAYCEHLFLLSVHVLVNHEQLKSKSEVANERLTTFTQLLPMLNRLNIEHHAVLSQVRERYPHLVFPELYVEMFAIGADDPPHFFKVDSDGNFL